MVELEPEQELPTRTMLPPVADTEFDQMATLTRRVLHAPAAMVSLVDQACHVFPGAVGLHVDLQRDRQLPLSHSLCRFVVSDAEALIVADAREDSRTASNGAVTDYHVVAYAGMPLVDAAGDTIGSLCVVDFERREWTPEEVETLRELAAACSAQLNLREANARAAVTAERDRMADELRSGVIRDLFDVSLALGSVRSQNSRGGNTAGVDSELAGTIDQVDAVISRIRSSLFQR